MDKISDDPTLEAQDLSAYVPIVSGGANYKQTVAVLLGATGNYLTSGGGVVWEQDYDYTVGAASYVIQGTAYSSPETPVTLDPADATNDRIDIIAVDTNGDVVVITGTPAANPQAPAVDPDTQLQLTFVYVSALSTEPDVTVTVLFRENAGTPTEWAYSDNSANLSGSDTAQPYAGTIDIAGTSCVAGDRFILTAAAPVSLANQSFLSLRVRPNGTWAAAKSLRISWASSGVNVGSVVSLQNGAYGFNTASATYQTIAIPISAFGAITSVDSLRVRVNGGGANLSFYVDNVELQSGIGPPETVVDASAVTYTPSVLADWDGSADPGNADGALDQLAERVKDLESGGSAVTSVTGTANEISSTGGTTPVLSLPATIDLGGKTSLEIPNSAAPTVDADGEIAVDTTVTDFSHGILKYYSGEEMAVVALPIAQLASPTNNYVVTYDSTADEFQLKAQSGGSGGTELKGLTFTSDTGSTADSDPGNGLFKWNNATQGSATVLYFDNQTADAISVSTFWAALGPSGLIYLQQSDDSTKWQLWKWTATPTNGTGYYKFTVTLMANGGSIGNSKTVLCQFYGLTATAAADLQGTGSDASAAGFRGVPQNPQGGNYTLVLSDAGKHIYHATGDGSGDTYTIPANSSVAFPIGTAVTFINEDSNSVSIAITTDTMTLAGTTNTGTRTLAQNGVATAIKTTSTKWVISGSGLT